jgi:hypothetical protein
MGVLGGTLTFDCQSGVPWRKLVSRHGYSQTPARNLRVHSVRSWNSSLPLAADHPGTHRGRPSDGPDRLQRCGQDINGPCCRRSLVPFQLASCPGHRTSASWSQLKKQFFDTIRTWQRHPLFRFHTFNEAEVRAPEGGFVIGLSVDEAGKAEGYHERPASPVMILADEASRSGTMSLHRSRAAQPPGGYTRQAPAPPAARSTPASPHSGTSGRASW